MLNLYFVVFHTHCDGGVKSDGLGELARLTLVNWMLSQLPVRSACTCSHTGMPLALSTQN